jgi:hypothetical protein
MSHMLRIGVLCEGATETEFVKTCLYPHFLNKNIHLTPKDMGGNVSVERTADLLCKFAINFDFITTLLDFYGFKHNENTDGTATLTIAELEVAIISKIQAKSTNLPIKTVIPYIQQYEFEALLFSDIRHFDWVLDAWTTRARAKLEKICQQFPNPEDINHGRQTAPSKRLDQVFDGYFDKVEHGPLIAESIGLPMIRQKCPRFDAWITRLEQLV